MKAIPNLAGTIEIVSIFLIADVYVAICSARSVPVSGGLLFFYYIGTAWAFTDWILADSWRLHVPLVIDHGYFVFFTFPFSLLYHLFRTRGFLKGTLAVVGFLGLWVGTWAFSLVVFFALRSL